MNSLVIAFFAVIAVAAAATLPAASSADAQAETVRFDSAVNPDSFQYQYETSNGIKAQEAGQLKKVGEESGVVAQGNYAYQSPEGQLIQVSYVADENGYQPTGEHLPTPPPIPDAIRRALEYLAEHAPAQQ